MYNVIDPYGDQIGKYSSIEKSIKAVENYYCSNISKSKKSVAYNLRMMGWSAAPCIMDESIRCTIEKI